ncbi:MAG: hypothetical protein WCH61_10740 [bacterium]
MGMKKMAKPPLGASYNTRILRHFLELNCAVESVNLKNGKFENSLVELEKENAKMASKTGNRAKKRAQRTDDAIKVLREQKSSFDDMLVKCDERLKDSACALTQEVKATVGADGILALRQKALFGAASAKAIQKAVLAAVCAAFACELAFGLGASAGFFLAVIGVALYALERNFRKDALCLEKILDAEKMAADTGKK